MQFSKKKPNSVVLNSIGMLLKHNMVKLPKNETIFILALNTPKSQHTNRPYQIPINSENFHKFYEESRSYKIQTVKKNSQDSEFFSKIWTKIAYECNVISLWLWPKDQE